MDSDAGEQVDDEARTIVIAGPHTRAAVDVAQMLMFALNLKSMAVFYDVELDDYYPV